MTEEFHLVHTGLLMLLLVSPVAPDSLRALVLALSEKMKYHSVRLLEMCNSCKSVFPNTRAWEQQKNKNNKETEEGKKRGVSRERSKAGTKEKKVLTA